MTIDLSLQAAGPIYFPRARLTSPPQHRFHEAHDRQAGGRRNLFFLGCVGHPGASLSTLLVLSFLMHLHPCCFVSRANEPGLSGVDMERRGGLYAFTKETDRAKGKARMLRKSIRKPASSAFQRIHELCRPRNCCYPIAQQME